MAVKGNSLMMYLRKGTGKTATPGKVYWAESSKYN